jgi:hypothetical protein
LLTLITHLLLHFGQCSFLVERRVLLPALAFSLQEHNLLLRLRQLAFQGLNRFIARGIGLSDPGSLSAPAQIADRFDHFQF